LDLKSVEMKTDFWISQDGVVVKFVDTLPQGAEANSLEATLQE